MMKLAYSVSFIPRYAIPEITIEYRKILLWKHPRVANIHLQVNTNMLNARRDDYFKM
jgi:hypothetical protein